MGHREQINTTFVVVPLAEGEEAVLTMVMDPIIADEIYRLGKKDWKSIIYHSDCIKNMVPFEDEIRFALKKSNNTCTVGLTRVYEWILDKTLTTFKKLSKQAHRGYLEQKVTKKYTLPDEDNITLTFVF